MATAYTLVLRGILQDRKGRFLLMKRSAECKGWPGKWEFPGGKVSRGEELTEALIREWREETGLNVVPVSCVDVFDHKREHDRILYFIFNVKLKSSPSRIPSIKISSEHDDLGWFTPADLKVLDVSPVLKRVVDAICA